MGRKAHKPTEATKNQVKIMATMGMPHADIARVLELGSVNTLKKHYALELKIGRDDVNARIVAALVKSALRGNVAAQIFWCKTRMGWRETGFVPEDIEPPVIEYVELPENTKPPLEEITDGV